MLQVRETSCDETYCDLLECKYIYINSQLLYGLPFRGFSFFQQRTEIILDG